MSLRMAHSADQEQKGPFMPRMHLQTSHDRIAQIWLLAHLEK